MHSLLVLAQVCMLSLGLLRMHLPRLGKQSLMQRQLQPCRSTLVCL